MKKPIYGGQNYQQFDLEIVKSLKLSGLQRSLSINN